MALQAIAINQTPPHAHSKLFYMVLLDGAAPPSDAYKATVIAGILKEHMVEIRTSQYAANFNTVNVIY